MILNCKSISLFLLILLQNQLSHCGSDDFQTNVDGFIEAFDDAYSAEMNTPTTDDAGIVAGNEVPLETSVLEEGTIKQNEGDPAQEEVAVTETVFQLGGEIKHELTEEIQAMAEKALSAISSDLKLINVTEAVSMVTNKIQRSLSLVVGKKACDDPSCVISCRVELVSRDGVDEVTWHNCLDSATSNEVTRDKRGAIGGFKEVDEAEAKELSEIAAQTLDSIDADDTKRVVTEVIRAQKQLHHGILYQLILKVALSDCKEEEEKCEGTLSDHNICKILMQRLFSGEAPHSAQVIKSECTPISKAKEIVYNKNKKQVKRHVAVEGSESNMITNHVSTKKTYHRIAGGKTRQDPYSDKIKEISEFALAAIDKSSNSLNKQKIVRVVDARSQVVAGVKYFLKLELVETNCRKDSNQDVCTPVGDQAQQSCDVVVWDKPWEKFRTITRVECTPIQRRAKRALVGGKRTVDPNDAKVQEMAQFAVSQLDAQSNSLNKQKLILVKEAQTQVVAGTNYYMKLQLVETNCRKGSSENEVCSAGPNKAVQECDVIVYDRIWDHHREMTGANCSATPHSIQVRKKRGMLVGGFSPGNKDSDETKEIAQFAVEDLNKKSNSMYKQTLVEVVSVQTQVVSGINYLLTLKIAETECKKSNAIKSAICTPKESAAYQECNVTVWSQPWLKKREVTNFVCRQLEDTQAMECQQLETEAMMHNVNEQHASVKRSRDLKTIHKREVFVGGHLSQDKNSDEIQEIAQFAVEDLNKNSDSLYKQTLIEVISAHKQIVAGINYNLKLRIVETECKKNSGIKSADCSPKRSAIPQECDITVWKRTWLEEQKLLRSNCKPIQDEQVIGSPKPVDPLAPDVLEAAKLSLKSIDKSSNSMYKHALIRVLDARTQTVSGIKYFLTMEIGESECTKNHNKENCAVRADNSLNDKCNVVVWDQPWLGKKEVLHVTCGLRSGQSVTNRQRDLKQLHLTMFKDFKMKYNKVYADEVEHNKRFHIFRANLKKIQAFQENEQGTAIYGPNMFADLTAKEFKQKYLGLKPGPGPKPSKNHMLPVQIPNVALPVDFDWRDQGAVTPVKNQGQCGSCWAFSVTGNVEGQWFLKHGKLLSLSEQELVDCDKVDSGCNGGYMTSAYEAIEKLGGLDTEDMYPYDAEDETCKFNLSEAQVTVTSSVNITTNETQIAQWLFAKGPISIGINANAMQFYMGGVSHPFKFLCSKNQLDHGVLLVGFGVHRTSIRHKLLPYWLVKNSWGSHWGEKGYYRVYRGDGTCGVNQMASSAIVG